MGLLDATAGTVRFRVGRLRSGIALLGPAFVAAIAYVDPGNVATNVAAGATYGYLLVWVIVAANLMAFLVQYLSAKLGLVTGQSLPEALRERMPRAVRLGYWGQAEAVAMATDLAEVLGGAIALQGAETGESPEGAHAAVSLNLGPAIGLLFAVGLPCPPPRSAATRGRWSWRACCAAASPCWRAA